MSWYVEGRRYHDYLEYQNALASAERRKSGRAADELATENRRLSETIARDRQSMDQVRGDVHKQMEISQRIQSNVQTLERNQRRFEDVMKQTERRMQDGFSQLENEIEQQGGQLHGLDVDLNQLKQNHQRHVEEVRTNLNVVRREMASGLEQAEQQRRLTEERLRDTIRAVGERAERDRAERARQTKDQLALATIEADAALDVLASVSTRAQLLDLSGNTQQVAARLASAQTLIAQQNAASALGVCTLARADAESLANEARSREIELEMARREFERRADWVATAVGIDASQDLKDCYELECERVKTTLAAARSRLKSRYQNYRLLQIERHEDGQILDQLEGEVLDIVSSGPVVAEAAERRLVQADEALGALERVYGTATRVERSFARSLDPKSDLIVRTVFGSSKIDLRFALDGSMAVDGYGHSTASDCSVAAHRVLQELQAQAIVGAQSTDDFARSVPRTRSAVQSTSDAKREVS